MDEITQEIRELIKNISESINLSIQGIENGDIISLYNSKQILLKTRDALESYLSIYNDK